MRLTSDHPFTILDCRGLNPTAYHICYGLSAPWTTPSTLYQTVWHTRAEIKARGDISHDLVDRAIQTFERTRGKRPEKALVVKPKSPLKEKRPSEGREEEEAGK